MGNDLVGLSEAFWSELEGDLNTARRVSGTSERIRRYVSDLWIVVSGVPVLSNRKVSICVGAPGAKELTTKMASEDLAEVFPNGRAAGRRATVTASCLEIPLHVEVNMVRGLARR